MEDTETDIENDSTLASDEALTGAAIAAFTALSRRGRDMGEVVCHVVTAAAANVGGVGELLARRTGSWEADYVRQIVESTAGDGLLRWRTDPIPVPYTTADVFNDLGLDELCDADGRTVGEEIDRLDQAIFDAYATPEEAAKSATEVRDLTEQRAVMFTTGEKDAAARARYIAAGEAHNALWQAVQERASASGGPLVVELDAAETLADTISGLYEADLAAHAEAAAATVRRVLDERGLDRVPFAFVEHVDGDELGSYELAGLIDDLVRAARDLTPLPMTGAEPDYSDGTPALALRRAGLTYIERARRAIQ